jgi:hypothetical protein
VLEVARTRIGWDEHDARHNVGWIWSKLFALRMCSTRSILCISMFNQNCSHYVYVWQVGAAIEIIVLVALLENRVLVCGVIAIGMAFIGCTSQWRACIATLLKELYRDCDSLQGKTHDLAMVVRLSDDGA